MNKETLTKLLSAELASGDFSAVAKKFGRIMKAEKDKKELGERLEKLNNFYPDEPIIKNPVSVDLFWAMREKTNRLAELKKIKEVLASGKYAIAREMISAIEMKMA